MAQRRATVTLNPLFKWAIIANVSICAVCFIGMIIVLVIGVDPLSQVQERFYGTCEKAFYLTTGAFVGLLGGRAAKPDI